METLFIRVTIPGVKLAEVVELKEQIDALLEPWPEAAVELNIVKRPNMGYPASLPRPPGG